MSIVFNDPTTLKGLVQFYEKECGFNRGDISNSPTKLLEFAAEANVALDDFFAIALPASGTWQLDDSNHEKYPIIKANLVAGQRDYPFTTDQEGAVILDIFKVLVASPSGIFSEIDPVDVQTSKKGSTTGFTSGQDLRGTPNEYDKTANGIFLDPIPNYDYERGLEIYINREASYFSSTDMTKKAGVPGLFHKFFFLKPALNHLRRNNGANLKDVAAEVLKLEGDKEKGIVGSIERYFSKRTHDERPRMRPSRDSNK